jgi:hypothetical protein
MPYQPGYFFCDEYPPIPAEQAVRKAHDGQDCEVVKAFNNWTYQVRFADGVEVRANESEVSSCITGTTFWGGRPGLS